LQLIGDHASFGFMQGVMNLAGTRSVVLNVMLSSASLTLLATTFSPLPGLGVEFVAVSLGIFVVASLPVLFFVGRHLETAHFGPANVVTLLRLALTAMLLALVIAPASTALLWLCIGVATVTLLLDGLDGRLARKYGSSSRFGARFDMEVDAVLICVLALLAWHFERAGIWVLAAGLFRYAFVGAAMLLPWLRAALPPSTRRKTVCILQSTTLLICMGPIIPVPLAPWVAAAGIALLTWSFALDVLWLYEHRDRGVQA
jgi:phosphatidylglycerophosphate synthase